MDIILGLTALLVVGLVGLVIGWSVGGARMRRLEEDRAHTRMRLARLAGVADSLRERGL
jgi:hypothetical protein